MSLTHKRHWLIAYDIADPKRLGRIYRHIQKEAIPVQYSLYLYQGNAKQVHKLLDELAQHINPKQDDIRAYPIPNQTEIHTIGQCNRGGDIILSDANFGTPYQAIQRTRTNKK